MYELIAVGFEGVHRASEVLNEVQSLSDRWTFSVRDGVTVYRTANGKLHIDQSVQPTSREAAGWGGLLVRPESVEFWQGRVGRLHDRLRYRRDGDIWVVERLAP